MRKIFTVLVVAVAVVAAFAASALAGSYGSGTSWKFTNEGGMAIYGTVPAQANYAVQQGDLVGPFNATAGEDAPYFNATPAGTLAFNGTTNPIGFASSAGVSNGSSGWFTVQGLAYARVANGTDLAKVLPGNVVFSDASDPGAVNATEQTISFGALDSMSLVGTVMQTNSTKIVETGVIADSTTHTSSNLIKLLIQMLRVEP